MCCGKYEKYMDATSRFPGGLFGSVSQGEQFSVPFL
jgi:hypothetical protein